MHDDWDPSTVPRIDLTTTAEVLAMCEELTAADEIIPGVQAFADVETEVNVGSDLNRDGAGPWATTSYAAQFTSPLGVKERRCWVINWTDIDCDIVAPYLGKIPTAAWNASFEDEVYLRDGIDVTWRDPMLWLALLDLGKSVYGGRVWYTSLNDATIRFGGRALFGKGSLQLSFRRGIDLTEDQKQYSAQDSTVGLWLAPKIWDEVVKAGLVTTVDINDRARRFIDWMKREGLEFAVDGWREHLNRCQEQVTDALARMAELTDGGEVTLFGPSGAPKWSPSSDEQMRNALNTWANDEVRAYLRAEADEDRTFIPADTVDTDVLKLMVSSATHQPEGSDSDNPSRGQLLAKALLDWKAAEKTVTTYGEKLLGLLHDDSRFHSRYNQALTATVRLSSDKPNAQNLDPAMKKYFVSRRRNGWRRVKICADYSQAELRVLTVESHDQGMWQAYEDSIDIHEDTAGKMFHVDMQQLLLDEELDRYAAFRSKAKPINFGIGYGIGAAKLARGMTVQGIPTTTAEGKELLERWLEIRPGVKQYLEGRDTFIENLANNLPECDWRATLVLHSLFPRVRSAYKKLKNATGLSPSPQQVAEDLGSRHFVEAELGQHLGRRPTPEELDAELASRLETVRWVLTFKAPVVLTADGHPLEWESRTAANCRRVWDVPTEDWVWEMVQLAALSRKPQPAAIRDAWAAENRMTLSKGDKPLTRSQLRKCFDGRNKPSRDAFVGYVLAHMPAAAGYLCQKALSSCVAAKRNEYRNHPIQAGVGIIVLDAFGELLQVLKRYPSAAPVQSVHDSIVIECDIQDAKALMAEVKTVMEMCFTRWYPGVKAKADVDLQTSLSSKDKVTDEMLEEWLAEEGQHADEPYALAAA